MRLRSRAFRSLYRRLPPAFRCHESSWIFHQLRPAKTYSDQRRVFSGTLGYSIEGRLEKRQTQFLTKVVHRSCDQPPQRCRTPEAQATISNQKYHRQEISRLLATQSVEALKTLSFWEVRQYLHQVLGKLFWPVADPSRHGLGQAPAGLATNQRSLRLLCRARD